MWALLQTLLDTILPRKARVVRIDSYTLADLDFAPTPHEAHGIEITTLMSYRTRAVEDLIRALKYDRATHAAKLLSESLAEYLREEISSIRLFSARSVLIVPIPLHSSRLRERGFNQVEVILTHLPTEFKNGTEARYAPGALARIRATPQQTRLSRDERFKNVAGAFSVPDASVVRDTTIILIDDVTTTGATLASAAKALEKSGAHVTAIALAHA